MFTKVVGVSFIEGKSFDGMLEGQELILIPEPDNEHDQYAVGVYRRAHPDPKVKNLRIGYIKASQGLNREVFEAIKEGKIVRAVVTNLTGDWIKNREGTFDASVTHEIGINFSLTIE